MEKIQQQLRHNTAGNHGYQMDNDDDDVIMQVEEESQDFRTELQSGSE